MGLFLLFLVVLNPGSQAYVEEDIFQKHVQNNLNHAVSPCDDFYDHVCTGNNSKFRMWMNMREGMEKFLEPYLSSNYKEIMKIIKETEKIVPANFEKATEMKAEIRKSCGITIGRCKLLLRVFYPQIENQHEDLSLDEITDMIFERVREILNEKTLTKKDEENIMERLYTYATLEAAYKAMETDEKFRQDYVEAERMTDEMMDILKETMVRNFENTKWMNKQYSVKMYQELIVNITREKFYDPSVEEDLLTAFDRALSIFKNCNEAMFQWHPVEAKFCVIFALNHRLFTGDLPEHKNDVLNMNAAYSQANIVVFYFQALFPFLKDRISQLGTIGFILAHEMSHAIFIRQESINELLPQNLECITKHRKEVCSISNFTCHMGKPTISEDAPDITALAVILDIFKDEAKNDFLLDGNPPNVTKEQFLFYVTGSIWCTDELDHKIERDGKPDTHSPNKGRVNALFMHSEVFQESFKCKEGDKMWRKPDNFCNLLGPEATRR